MKDTTNLKKKILNFSLIATSLFILPILSKAEVTYNRQPDEATITSPVTISVTMTDFLVDSGCTGNFNWGVSLIDETSNYFAVSNFISTSTLSNDFVINLPVGQQVWGVDFAEDSGQPFGDACNSLEGTGASLIFTIIEANTLIPTLSSISADYFPIVGLFSSAIFADFGDGGFIEIIAGLIIGGMIVYAVMKATIRGARYVTRTRGRR